MKNKFVTFGLCSNSEKKAIAYYLDQIVGQADDPPIIFHEEDAKREVRRVLYEHQYVKSQNSKVNTDRYMQSTVIDLYYLSHKDKVVCCDDEDLLLELAEIYFSDEISENLRDKIKSFSTPCWKLWENETEYDYNRYNSLCFLKRNNYDGREGFCPKFSMWPN